MTDRPPPSSARAADRRRPLARAGLITLAIAVGGTAVLGGGAWLLRRELARDAATDWLEKRGVDSEIEIERLELDGFVGRLRVGPKDAPDLAVERIEVDYALTGPWAGRAFGATPSRVRLVRPVLKARWTKDGLDLGRLDPLIEELTKRPPRPDQRGPKVTVEGGRLDLQTDFGLMRASADAVIDDGKLLTLDARLPATRLAGRGFDGRITAARLTARRSGGRLAATFRGEAERLRGTGLTADAATLRLDAALPYPDLKRRSGDGEVSLDGTLVADRLGTGGADGRAVDLAFRFDGAAKGWVETLALDGAGSVKGRLGALAVAGVEARSATLDARAETLRTARTADGLTWRAAGDATLVAASARQGGLRLDGVSLRAAEADFASGRDGAASGDFRLAIRAEQGGQDDLAFEDLAGDFTGSGRFGTASSGVQLRGALTADRTAWTGLGAPASGDFPEAAALKRALADMRLSAPAVELGVGDEAVFALERPLILSPRSGGTITLAERRDAPLYRGGAGAFDVTLQGGGLPTATARVSRYRTGGGPGGFRFDADLGLEAALDFGPARTATLDADGRLSIGGGALRFLATRCAPVTTARLELGENDVTGVAGALCPTDVPLLTVADGGWRVRGRAQAFDADAPFLQMRVTEARGPVDVRGGRALSLDARIDSARVADTARPLRFYPVEASGPAALRGEVWTADLALRRPGQEPTLATAAVRHDGRSGEGAVEFRADALTFADGGLQPADLTPLAGLLGPPVAGAVDFAGGFRWTATGGTSGGRLTVKSLDFTSPLGPLSGLSGEVELTSLAPLISAPNQRLRAASVESFAALSDADVRFQLVDQTLKVEGGEVVSNGGVITLEPFDVALAPGAIWQGAVRLSGVGLSPIVEASGFKDSVDLQAAVSGRLPFVVGPEGVRFVDGRLAADRPGRLSIQRSALAGVNASGGGEAAQAAAETGGGVQDFAYQALENLSFDLLNAEVNSLPEGRLGVLFRIQGRHDPPDPEQLRLTWLDVLQRRFLDKKLPLPAGTEVDLTLDSTLNLDQLLADWRDVNASRSGRSEPVQPRP